MTFPLIDYVYEYENKEVLVLSTIHFYNVLILQYNKEHENSEVKSVNWFKFVFNAKKLRKTKIIM